MLDKTGGNRDKLQKTVVVVTELFFWLAGQ